MPTVKVDHISISYLLNKVAVMGSHKLSTFWKMCQEILMILRKLPITILVAHREVHTQNLWRRHFHRDNTHDILYVRWVLPIAATS